MFSFLKKHYDIYTDGSHKNGIGSWAYVISSKSLLRKSVIQENSARVKKTSSNRMEFQAAIEALKMLPARSKATVYSDSQILIHTMNVMLPQWRSANWLKRNGRSIPNVDLVQALAELNRQHSLRWQWIKAHSGIPLNERCDQLCTQARS